MQIVQDNESPVNGGPLSCKTNNNNNNNSKWTLTKTVLCNMKTRKWTNDMRKKNNNITQIS